MLIEFIKFFVYSIIIVVTSKYALVKLIRNLAKILNLKPKTVGNIAGIATSVPELLTVSFSSLTGLIGTGIFNIISSNIINLIQYLVSVFLNKNQNKLKNVAIKTDLILVIFTILIPIGITVLNIESSLWLVFTFIILFFIFNKISKNAHKVYLKHEELDQNIENTNISKVLNIIALVIVVFLLYLIGNLLGETLKTLCINLNVPESVMGILLGVITSIPEFITFIEAQRHHKDKESHEGIVEATSNLLFSNLMNLFVIQSIGIILFFIFV